MFDKIAGSNKAPLYRARFLLLIAGLVLTTACSGQWIISPANATQIAATIAPVLKTQVVHRLPPLPTPILATAAAPETAASSPTAILLPTMVPATMAPATPLVAFTTPPSPAVATPPPAEAPLPTPRATLPSQLGQREETWTVLFTPGSGPGSDVAGQQIVDNLIQYIDAAQTSIHLAVYQLNLTPIADALIRAHNRGVDVRFVTDNEGGLKSDTEEGHGQFAMLQAAGVEVRSDTRSALMHNKFIIIDNTIFITGSTNLTVNDIFKNNNNIVAAPVPEVAAIYEREFDEMWNGAFGPTSPSQSGQAVLDVYGQPFVVLFAPEDDPFDTMVQLVSAAESSIRFMAFSFTNDALGQAMLERAQSGVDVRGIFEVRGSETQYAELPRLYCAGVPVRQDGNPQTFHHKVVVIDNYVVITGSMNFSDSAANANDENMVAISSPGVAELYLQEFDRRWAESTLPHPEDMNCPQLSRIQSPISAVSQLSSPI